MLRLALALLTASPAVPPQEPAPQDAGPGLEESVAAAVAFLLEVQEGEDRSEWPYEGVYRVQGRIPIGYRVGGTGIVGLALLEAADYDRDRARREAVERATRFVVRALEHPQMNPDYDGGYDVRGWGHCYGLAFLLRLQKQSRIPEGMEEPVDAAIRKYVSALLATECPGRGGWNYARPQGKDTVAPASSFMTAPCLQSLFEAAAQGYAVDEAVLTRALSELEGARTPSGAVIYRISPGAATGPGAGATPGAVGRMAIVESTLFLAGRSDPSRLRGAVDAFLVHWEWLEKRRARRGTHEGPYGIAPYYFYFAHYYAAQAIELLPEAERAEYRRRLRERIFATRDSGGSWNDRVFERSANFGTAMSVLALRMPQAGPPAAWRPASDPSR